MEGKHPLIQLTGKEKELGQTYCRCVEMQEQALCKATCIQLLFINYNLKERGGSTFPDPPNKEEKEIIKSKEGRIRGETGGTDM